MLRRVETPADPFGKARQDRHATDAPERDSYQELGSSFAHLPYRLYGL